MSVRLLVCEVVEARPVLVRHIYPHCSEGWQRVWRHYMSKVANNDVNIVGM